MDPIPTPQLSDHERPERSGLAEARTPSSSGARLEVLPRARLAHGRRRALYGGAAVGLLAAIALLIVLLPAGAPGGPSVFAAAMLPGRGTSSPAPAPDPHAPETMLDLHVGGVYFPNWLKRLGWAAVGQRSDQLAGRRIVTVFYQGHGSTVAYSIVAGRALARPGGTRVRLGDVSLRTFSVNGRLVVSWRRGGHTCVLSGMGITASQLEQLASWQ